MNRRFLAAAPVAALALTAAVACGPAGGSGASVPSIFTPDPTSTQVKAAETAGQQLLARCQPKGDTTTQWEVAFVFHPVATATALENCENVPASQRQAFAVCVTSAAKAAHKDGSSKAAEEASFINGAAKCAPAAQGASPSPSASSS